MAATGSRGTGSQETGADPRSREDLLAELATVQREAQEAQADLDRLRRGLGDSGAGTTDAAEGAMLLTGVDEQAALVDALRTRERAMRARLGLPD